LHRELQFLACEFFQTQGFVDNLHFANLRWKKIFSKKGLGTEAWHSLEGHPTLKSLDACRNRFSNQKITFKKN
jgi:hypothetical protein